ncbi:unnamed protein product, partial [marine sediment metagenome]
ERLDVHPQESIFIDDFPHNVDGAQNLAIRLGMSRTELENLVFAG